MSEVPPAELGIVGAERAVQLREILDRIDLPPIQDVPDDASDLPDLGLARAGQLRFCG
jgi:hypothetical protein